MIRIDRSPVQIPVAISHLTAPLVAVADTFQGRVPATQAPVRDNMDLGNPVDVLEVFSKKRAPADAALDDRVLELIEKTRQALAKKDYETAKQMIDELETARPWHPLIGKFRAEILVGSKRAGEALKQLEGSLFLANFLLADPRAMHLREEITLLKADILADISVLNRRAWRFAKAHRALAEAIRLAETSHELKASQRTDYWRLQLKQIPVATDYRFP